MVYYKWIIIVVGIKVGCMIKESLCFADFGGFYVKKEIIRSAYAKMTIDGKAIYKYYVYSHRVIKDRVCDAMWEYLNAIDTEEVEMCAIKLDKMFEGHK